MTALDSAFVVQHVRRACSATPEWQQQCDRARARIAGQSIEAADAAEVAATAAAVAMATRRRTRANMAGSRVVCNANARRIAGSSGRAAGGHPGARGAMLGKDTDPSAL